MESQGPKRLTLCSISAGPPREPSPKGPAETLVQCTVTNRPQTPRDQQELTLSMLDTRAFAMDLPLGTSSTPPDGTNTLFAPSFRTLYSPLEYFG